MLKVYSAMNTKSYTGMAEKQKKNMRVMFPANFKANILTNKPRNN